MSSINSNTSSSKAGRSLARSCADNDLTSKSTFKDSFVDAENDSDFKPFLKGNNKVERLQRENAKLKEELADLRVQYEQLLNEEKEEVFDVRRVNLLKAQVMQLERQVILLSEGLSSQTCRCLEVENALEPLTERLRSLLSMDSPSVNVTVARTELTQLIEKCADVRQKLHRNNKVKTLENLSMPWIMSKRSLVKQPVTLVDLCYGNTNNLNLQQVSALESRLSQLFKHLHGMRQTLGFLLAPEPSPSDQARMLLPSSAYARLVNQATRCICDLDRCCSDLLTLSLIVPSAPWADCEQRVTQELNTEDVLLLLPHFPRGASQQRAQRAAEALVRAANYPLMMAQLQVEALQAELDFHRTLYALQVKHTDGLVGAVRQAYQSFQENVARTLCLPLRDVLSCYDGLKSSASEAALRQFLTAFKNNSQQIQEAVEALDPSNNEGDEALSRYGRDFFHSVEELQQRCVEQRERSASELRSLESEHQEAWEHLRALKRERRERKGEPREALSSSGREWREPPEPTLDPAPTPCLKQNTPRKALPAASPSTASEGGPSRQSRVNQREANQTPGKSSMGRKTREIPPRPEWQS